MEEIHMGFAFGIVMMPDNLSLVIKIISSWDLLVSLPLGLEVEKGGEHALKRSPRIPLCVKGSEERRSAGRRMVTAFLFSILLTSLRS
jgi:hypothetical protein